MKQRHPALAPTKIPWRGEAVKLGTVPQIPQTDRPPPAVLPHLPARSRGPPAPHAACSWMQRRHPSSLRPSYTGLHPQNLPPPAAFLPASRACSWMQRRHPPPAFLPTIAWRGEELTLGTVPHTNRPPAVLPHLPHLPDGPERFRGGQGPRAPMHDPPRSSRSQRTRTLERVRQNRRAASTRQRWAHTPLRARVLW
ncbi:hypothetical protein T484DRAFT_1972593 [Baffinella frigidus]|nr:hypothetical protein T484DRAFT_1972593 [Cryptophyta sp. CCMP2293]